MVVVNADAVAIAVAVAAATGVAVVPRSVANVIINPQQFLLLFNERIFLLVLVPP